MGFLDRLFGTGDDSRRAGTANAPRGAASEMRDADGRYVPPAADSPGAGVPASGTSEDQRAIERYRYLLRTAAPETVEQVHAEAFEKLSAPQRQQVLQELSSGLDPSERPRSDAPAALARAATRAEYRQPGFMERTFGNRSFSNGPGFGSMLGASMLGTIGGYVVASALVGSLFDPGYDAGYADGAAADDGAADSPAADDGADDGGGDFGGGDFGGGDFGGGDFGF